MPLQDAKPFLGLVAAESNSGADPQDLWIAVFHAIVIDAVDRDAEIKIIEEQSFGDLGVAGDGITFHLAESRPVAWMPKNSGIKDHLNHLLALVSHPPYAFIHVSDAVLKASIERIVTSGAVPLWRRLSQSSLVHAFVKGKPLKALWLSGTHGAVSIKPTSKVLAGTDLRDALDPLGDTTFIAGAVRSSAAGVSIRKSGVWQGRTRDWTTFANKVAQISAEIAAAQALIAANPTMRVVVHDTLATELDDLTGVADPYHVQWQDSETVQDPAKGDAVRGLAEAYDLELLPKPPGASPSDVHVRFTDNAGAQQDVMITLEIDQDGLNFHIPAPLNHTGIEAVLGNSSFLNVYFDSGHSAVDGTITLSLPTDRDFSFDFQSFANCNPGMDYAIDEEKPAGWPGTIDALFSVADLSLFKWVYRNLPNLGLQQPDGILTWLYCDDGAMEVADFVHVTKGPLGGRQKVTLIHVKACSTSAGRRPCTGPYEIVIAQAMKNLRDHSAGNLLKRIRGRAQTAFIAGQGRVWEEPWIAAAAAPPAVDPANFLAALDAMGVDCDYEVVVVQPHVNQTQYNAHRNNIGARQLRALLFSANAAAKGALAQFRVVVSDA